MIFKFDRDVLRSALAVVNSAVEKKGTIPVLSFLLLESKDGGAVITGTDLDVTITLSVEAECEGSFCVPAASLRDAARLASESVSIKSDKGRAVVKSGEFVARLPLLEPANFPACPKPLGMGIKVNGKLFARMLKMVTIASDREENSRWALRSVCLTIKDSKLTLVSSDEHQLAVASIPAEGEDAEFLIPRQSVPVLTAFANSEDEIELAKTDQHFGLIGASGFVVSRLLVGKFPNWQMAVPKKFAHTIKAPVEDFALTLKQAAVGLDRNVATRWTISKKRLLISGKSPEREGSGVMPVECASLNGDEIALGVNGPMVLGFLATVSGDVKFSFNGPKESFEFLPEVEGFDYRYVTMAMRPDAF